jgi:hypothetical protein
MGGRKLILLSERPWLLGRLEERPRYGVNELTTILHAFAMEHLVYGGRRGLLLL